MFNNCEDVPLTPQYKDVLKQINTVKRAYCDGTHATLEQISWIDRPSNSSNDEVENINKMKNRIAKKCAKNNKKKVSII